MTNILEENLDKSIKPCDSLIDIYKELTEKYFKNYYNIIPLCMALGFKHGKKIEPSSTKTDGVRLSILFQNVPNFKYLYYGLSVKELGSLDGFSNEMEHQSERLRIAQLYLNGGLTILRSDLSTEINITDVSIRNLLLEKIFTNDSKKRMIDSFLG